jgi:hypothetical protein
VRAAPPDRRRRNPWRP